MAISPDHPRDPVQEILSKNHNEGLGKKIQLLETARRNVAAVFSTYPDISNDFLKRDEQKLFTQALKAIEEYIEHVKDSRLY